jgi:hypothetical protein
MKDVRLPYAALSYKEPIVNIVFKENIELGFLEIRELIYYAEKLSGKKPYFTLSEVPKNVKVTPVGRKLAADRNEAPYNKGSAVVINNVLMELAANFFQGAIKVDFPFKIFTDKEKAKDWLLNLELKKEGMN